MRKNLSKSLSILAEMKVNPFVGGVCWTIECLISELRLNFFFLSSLYRKTFINEEDKNRLWKKNCLIFINNRMFKPKSFKQLVEIDFTQSSMKRQWDEICVKLFFPVFPKANWKWKEKTHQNNILFLKFLFKRKVSKVKQINRCDNKNRLWKAREYGKWNDWNGKQQQGKESTEGISFFDAKHFRIRKEPNEKMSLFDIWFKNRATAYTQTHTQSVQFCNAWHFKWQRDERPKSCLLSPTIRLNVTRSLVHSLAIYYISRCLWFVQGTTHMNHGTYYLFTNNSMCLSLLFRLQFARLRVCVCGLLVYFFVCFFA